jgi:hypothetical protein
VSTHKEELYSLKTLSRLKMQLSDRVLALHVMYKRGER